MNQGSLLARDGKKMVQAVTARSRLFQSFRLIAASLIHLRPPHPLCHQRTRSSRMLKNSKRATVAALYERRHFLINEIPAVTDRHYSVFVASKPFFSNLLMMFPPPDNSERQLQFGH